MGNENGGLIKWNGINRESMCRFVFLGNVEMIKLLFGIIGIEVLIEREEREIMICKVLGGGRR